MSLREKLEKYAPAPTGQGLPCPRQELHTAGENMTYLGSVDWARKMIKTHRQKRCPGCGLFKIWVPR